MIEAGLVLARATGAAYRSEARATAHAVRALADARGIYADLQAENDIVEPLVRRCCELARGRRRVRAELGSCATPRAAAHARRPDGAYGRFFDGPPPAGTVTAWQTNGGLALAVAAGALAPDRTAEPRDPWPRRRPQVAVTRLPATLRFTGSGIALIGTIGERCCEPGRARLLLDGRELADRTGIWQNKSSLGRPLPESVLFAWRWPDGGAHVIRFEPDAANAKEGGPFLDVRATLIVP